MKHTHTHTHTQTHRHTHLHMQMLLWDKHTLTLKYVPGESNILPTINGRKKKKKQRGENNKLAERRPSFGRTTARKEEKTRREFFGIKQCFLYQQRKGPAWERGQAGNLRPEAPLSPIPLSLFCPPRCLYYFPLISPVLPPPTPPKKRVTLGHYSISLIPRSHFEQRGWRPLFYDQQQVQQALM